MPADPLVNPPPYFPPGAGVYQVVPGLERIDRQRDANDRRAFQVDHWFPAYRQRKLAARAERFAKYVRTHDLSPDVRARVASFIVEHLVSEHSDRFHLDANRTLSCHMTGDRLAFDEYFTLRDATSRSIDPPYRDALDALACQAQEDLAIVSSTSGDRHWVSYLHLCFPNRWSAEEKIGGSFAAIHGPVAGMEQMNRRAAEFVRLMVGATEGLVRFAWGITFGARLNQHPSDPIAAFDPMHPRAYLRVERQTIWGFPDVGATLFTIRTYVTDCATLETGSRCKLADAIDSMSEESARYKGLGAHRRQLTAWLRG